MDALPLTHPAIWAAICFLAEDDRYLRALAAHHPDGRGWCPQHASRWPCLTWRLADHARQLVEQHIPSPRAPATADRPLQPH